ncbi:MAG: M20/M25/M40 family metallo-hydrolase [Deltaproteobacteria bacterium]|nr:M20/M25/M40 family metallo-hydrolase [Deltaproteobacteria bacterium]
MRINKTSGLLARIALLVAWVACGSDPAAEPGAAPDRDAGEDGGGDAGNDTDTGSDTDEPECGPGSAAALRACVDRARYVTDLNAVAVERPPGSAGWQAVQDLCAARLTELGLEVELATYASGVNVIGRLEGSDPAGEVILSAHYDHVPDCPGADDNASGVAGVLEAARALTTSAFSNTLIVACWDEEEWGKVGSTAFVEGLTAGGEDVLLSLVFEMIGYRSEEPGSQQFPDGFELLFPEQGAWLAERDHRGDFLAAVGDEQAHEAMQALADHAAAVALPYVDIELTSAQTQSSLLADFRRSDHAPFWDAGIPAVMITDTANFRYGAYHCLDGEDIVDNLDHDFAAQVIAATVGAAAEALEVVP